MARLSSRDESDSHSSVNLSISSSSLEEDMMAWLSLPLLDSVIANLRFLIGLAGRRFNFCFDCFKFWVVWPGKFFASCVKIFKNISLSQLKLTYEVDFINKVHVYVGVGQKNVFELLMLQGPMIHDGLK